MKPKLSYKMNFRKILGVMVYDDIKDQKTYAIIDDLRVKPLCSLWDGDSAAREEIIRKGIKCTC